MKKPGITTTALAQVLGGGSEIQFLGSDGNSNMNVLQALVFFLTLMLWKTMENIDICVVRCNVYLKDGKFHGLLC
ncbi:hypothetical protein SOVF_114900 isoform B [Spinacia oleracea]|nr:hypothetical protein SOVF_114900 isoform B [Spinacia oleracea]